MNTIVEVLDNNRNVITEVKSLSPYDLSGNTLKYSKEMSDYGTCFFRISRNDNIFINYGDIFVPHKNHIRIRKGANIVWQGAIVDNPERTKQHVDIKAVTYEFYLSKKLIKRTSPDVNGTVNIFRIFKSGTMAQAISDILSETISDYSSSNHVLKNLTTGTIENPDYPNGLTTDSNGTALTGSWSFGESTVALPGPSLQYDYHNILYVLKSFANYTYADFEITDGLVFNFKKFLGNKKQNELSFVYGNQGNIVDYNAPRYGLRMMNKVTAIATDPNGVIISSDLSDENSINNYGLLEGSAAYSDVKGAGILASRVRAELPIVVNPDESNITLYLNEKCYPLGMYGIGDLVTVKIKDNDIDINQIRRIVGYTVVQHNTGRETIAVQTNVPYDWQIG